MKLKLNPISIERLSHGLLKENRQLTIAEQAECDYLIAAMARVAQHETRGPIGIERDKPYQNEKGEWCKGAILDPPEVALAKMRGTYEIRLMLENGHPEFKDLDPAFVDKLLAERERGYVFHESHKRGVPTQIIQAQNERRLAAEGGPNALAHKEHEQNIQAAHERVGLLEARLDEHGAKLDEHREELNKKIDEHGAKVDAMLGKLDALLSAKNKEG